MIVHDQLLDQTSYFELGAIELLVVGVVLLLLKLPLLLPLRVILVTLRVTHGALSPLAADSRRIKLAPYLVSSALWFDV